MSRKALVVVLGVILVAALLGGIVAARAQGESTLPTLTPEQLLTKVAETGPKTAAVSGDFAWTNDLLGAGGLSLPTGDAGLSSLLQSGNGRLWYQDGKVRLEVQGSNGDSALVMDGKSLWVYSSKTNSATEYTGLDFGAKTGAEADGAPLTLAPGMLQGLIDRLAPTATLAVTQEKVAGQDAYLLTLTPTADNTVFGRATVAFDGQRYVPLRVEVFAKGGDKAVLSAGFTRVSYAPVDASTFQFTPPAGAKVEHKTLPSKSEPATTTPETDRSKLMGAAGSSLTLEQAKAKAGFPLLLPADTSLPFAGAHVIPARGSMPAVAVLAYGKGFGSVAGGGSQGDRGADGAAHQAAGPGAAARDTGHRGRAAHVPVDRPSRLGSGLAAGRHPGAGRGQRVADRADLLCRQHPVACRTRSRSGRRRGPAPTARSSSPPTA